MQHEANTGSGVGLVFVISALSTFPFFVLQVLLSSLSNANRNILSSVFFVCLRSMCAEKEYKVEAIEKKETFADDVYYVLIICFVYEYQWDESMLLFDQPA